MHRNKFMKKTITKSKKIPNMETSKLSPTIILRNKSNSYKDFWIIKLNRKSC